MSPLRVLLLRDPPEEGGMSMERYADALGRSLRSETTHAVDELVPHIQPEPGESARQGSRSYVTRMIRYPVAAARCSADIYHVIDHGYAHAAALLPKDRTVVTAHDLMLLRSEQGITGFKGTLTSRSRFRWTVSYLRRVAHVICVSETTQNDVIDLVGVAPHRTSVVRHGIDEQFKPLPKAHTDRVRGEFADLGSKLLLNVSTGSPYKNVPGVLRTLHEVRRRGVDVGLLRVGQPIDRTTSDLLAQLGLTSVVRDFGRVSDSRLVELYNAADVCIHPSHWEGFGWPPLEAMACGTPVVASDTPALREIVGDSGLTAGSDRIDLLADHVEAILRDPRQAGELRRRGLRRAAEYQWNRVAEQVSSIYEEVTSLARPVSFLPLSAG